MSGTKLDPASVRVLVVEDDRDNRTVITRLLRLAGVDQSHLYESDGDAAAFLAKSGVEVDLVFLDLQMPKKDGYAVLAELRSDPRLRGLLIVALTANVMRRDVERCREAGFDGFIGKPIDGRRFSQVFTRILAGESVWTDD